jgi:hypothetical protein
MKPRQLCEAAAWAVRLRPKPAIVANVRAISIFFVIEISLGVFVRLVHPDLDPEELFRRE